MARVTLRTNKKYIRLSRALGSHLLALGALQTLWESCYECGDDRVGTAEDVADVIGWPASSGIDIARAMFDAGFLEADPAAAGEYVVHDLWDHAPDYVQKRRRRELERHARGAVLKHGGQVAPFGAKRRTTSGQCPPNGCTPAPAPAPAQRDQDPGLAAGVAPCGNVEKSRRSSSKGSNPGAVQALTIDLLQSGSYEDAADLKEDVKRACARLGFEYDASVVRRALDAAEAQRARQDAARRCS